ncbi:serine/arginine repetitive matrix-like protein [Perilla frutescens var. frutescens]|nr:serine/arginine repetitive matrix-like protein [Perilla frutescens var. frutescens]
MEEPESLAPCGSGRRSCGDSKSPEFEFWMVRNPSFPQPNLLSADELFSDGVLLPLHHLNISNEVPTPPPREAHASGSNPVPEPDSSATELSPTSSLTSSKRWRDIFRKNDKKGNGDDHSVKEKDGSAKERRREKKSGVSVGGASSAELNINIWPFARSRSAGNGGTRPRAASTVPRKVSSAPCSRSNSRGESKSRKWPSSPSRAGVHLGRSSPVWQVRRSGGGGRSSEAVSVNAEKVVKKDGNEGRRRVPVAGGSKGRVLSLNVPMCIGYRQHFSCRSNENIAGGVIGGAAGGGGTASGEGVRGSNLFNIRSLFTKKVY